MVSIRWTARAGDQRGVVRRDVLTFTVLEWTSIFLELVLMGLGKLDPRPWNA